MRHGDLSCDSCQDMDSDEYDLPGAENEAEGEEDEKARDYKGNSWILDD